MLWSNCALLCHPGRFLKVISGGLHFNRFITSSAAERLREHFDSKMKDKNVPLFRSFDNYVNSLPVRGQHQNLPLRLHEIPYYVHEDGMSSMAERLFSPLPTARAVVRYLAAPTASGKTSSILHAFLNHLEKGGNCSHYLYMSFANNNRRYYSYYSDENNISTHQVDAEKQGASFVYHCLKHLLDESPCAEGPFCIPCAPLDDVSNKLKYLLCDRCGNDSKILVHLDEHHRMLPSSGKKQAHFRRGALGTLAELPNVEVVATYTERPRIEASHSSAVCRYPVSLPSVDIKKVMEKFEELRLPEKLKEDTLKTTNRRILATLRFRLGMLFQFKYGLTVLHQHSPELEKEILEPFKKAKICKDTTEALIKCCNVCKFEYSFKSRRVDQNAAKFLVGVEDEDIDKVHRQVQGIVVAQKDTLSYSILNLMNSSDPTVPVYSQGCILFAESVSNPDYLSNTPLEAAYSWVLSCKSYMSKDIILGATQFRIHCDNLLPKRIFPGSDDSKYNLDDLEHNTIYYALERNGEPTHPLCDIFFRTQNDEVVLLDVTGGSQNLACKKMDKLNEWIKRNVTPFKLHGFIVAPLCTGETISHGRVKILRDEAVMHLGGLAQVLKWYRQ